MNSSPQEPSQDVDKPGAREQGSAGDETANANRDSRTRLAGSADAGPAEDAAAHLCRGQAPDAGLRGGAEEIDLQAGRLVEWARLRGLIIGADFFAGLPKHPGFTAEHEVFHRASDNRAIKRTYPGTFGVTPGLKGQQTAATPLFYLRRLIAMNDVFNSDMRVEGVSFGATLLIGRPGLFPSLVISQPWVRAADPGNPHPSEREIRELMRSLNFDPLPMAYFGWQRHADGMRLVDARPDNFIKSVEGVVPIDLVIEQWPASVHTPT